MNEKTTKTVDEEAAERPTRRCSQCGHTQTEDEKRDSVLADRVLEELSKAIADVVKRNPFDLHNAMDALFLCGRWRERCSDDVVAIYEERMRLARNTLYNAWLERIGHPHE